MSEQDDTRRPSFLPLVPSYQRIYIQSQTEDDVQLTRRYSIASSVFSYASCVSTASSDYGENGFLVLTSRLNDELVFEEDG